MEFNKKYFEERKINSEHLISILQWILSLNIKGKILDAGCRFGQRVHVGRELCNKNMIGIDLELFIKTNPFGYKEDILKIGPIINLPFKKEEFELVICYDILQYLSNIKEIEIVLQELKRVSNKYILIAISNSENDKIKKTREWWEYKIRKIGTIEETPLEWAFKEKIILVKVKI